MQTVCGWRSGSNTHFGTISVDPVGRALTFKIGKRVFSELGGAEQKRQYELNGDELSYRVPTRPDGNTPVFGWRRSK